MLVTRVEIACEVERPLPAAERTVCAVCWSQDWRGAKPNTACGLRPVTDDWWRLNDEEHWECPTKKEIGSRWGRTGIPQANRQVLRQQVPRQQPGEGRGAKAHSGRFRYTGLLLHDHRLPSATDVALKVAKMFPTALRRAAGNPKAMPALAKWWKSYEPIKGTSPSLF